MRKIKKIIAFAVFAVLFGTMPAMAVDVTLTIDEHVARPSCLDAAQRNLAAVLTEINRAQNAKEVVSVKGLNMDEFSKKSLARLWAVTPFYCDDEEIVERCWVFKNGNMMVSHIPLIITPEGEDFGLGTYQEAVVEFDNKGQITDFRFALDAQMAESMDHCGSVVEKEKQMIILQYVERFRTAYNQKDITTIEQMFSDDALIITGRVVMKKTGGDSQSAQFNVEYNKQNKQQYINNLRRAFLRNKWIDVKFTKIGDDDIDGGCAGITRSRVDKTKYGVRLHQSWKSSNYNDEGYLFLLWEFPENGGDPIIHVRTWQPEYAGGVRQKPDDNISTLGGFDL